MSAISILEALIQRETEACRKQELLCETTPWDSVERSSAAAWKLKHGWAADTLKEALAAIEKEARNGSA